VTGFYTYPAPTPTTALGIRDGKIFAIYVVKNPDKLERIEV